LDPDAVWGGEWVGRGMGVFDGNGDRRRARAVLGVMWGIPL